MLFEYCCQDMKDAMDDGLVGMTEDGVCDIEGWKVDFCPFCGERIIIRISCKGREAGDIKMDSLPLNDLNRLYGSDKGEVQ